MAQDNKTRQRIFLAAMVIVALLLAGMTIYNTMTTQAEKDAAAATTTSN